MGFFFPAVRLTRNWTNQMRFWIIFIVAKQHLERFWPGWNITLINIIGHKLLISHFLVKTTAEKKSKKKAKIKLLTLDIPLEMKVSRMTRTYIIDIIHLKLFKSVSIWAWKLGPRQCAAHCSLRLLRLVTHQTLVFSSSVTALRVSGRQAWRRKSPSSSTQLTLSPPSPNCPFLSPSSTTAPWTSRRRRSLTSLRRWWWVYACFALFVLGTDVSVGLLLQPFDLASKKYHIHSFLHWMCDEEREMFGSGLQQNMPFRDIWPCFAFKVVVWIFCFSLVKQGSALRDRKQACQPVLHRQPWLQPPLKLSIYIIFPFF